MTSLPRNLGILTPVEAAQHSPPLRQLFYSETFVDALLSEYDFSRDLKIELWNVLEGAAHMLYTLPLCAFKKIDAKNARKQLREVHALASRLAGLLSELTVNTEQCAEMKSEIFAESEKKNAVRRAVWALAHAQITHHSSQLLFTQDDFPFSTNELCSRLTKLAESASSLARSPYAKGSGPNKLMPLKAYTLSILHFWHVRAGKSYSRSHETLTDTSGRHSRKKTSIDSKRTKFVPFLKASLNEIGKLPPERSLQTAIEGAIAQLEGRSDEIPLAIADWNFV